MTKKSEIPESLNSKLGFNLFRTGLLFRRELIKALSEYGITPEQWQVLMALWDNNSPLSQNQIVQLTLKDKHSVSRMISRLSNSGWIKKDIQANDSRITLISLTPKSSMLKGKMQLIMKEHFSKVWNQFTQLEKDELLNSMLKLRTILGDL